jgi:hypothetical protein
MKNKSLKIRTIILVFITLSALSNCADYLDIVPDQTPTIEDAFTDRVHAQRFLATIYSYMPRIGNVGEDPAIYTSDEWVVLEESYAESTLGNYRGNRIKHGSQDISAPKLNYWNGAEGGRNMFVALRECNIFLENIHLVGPDLYEDERAQWIAEVKFFKAYYHFYLMRLYGPIPLIKENLSPGVGVNEVKVYREPVDDVIDYICQLCDEAIPDLPLAITNIATEYGRITRPIAATLKAQALVWGASPLFNGNSEYSTIVDNKGVHLFSATEDPTKWTKAAQAAKAAIDICNEAGINHLFVFNDARFVLSDTTRRLQSLRGAATIKWNDELIWGNPVNTTEQLQLRTMPIFKTEDRLGSGPTGDQVPAFTMAEQFYSNNGVPINEDKYYNYAARFDTITVGDDHYYYIPKGIVTAKLNTYREPRFYANLGFDGGYWFGNGRIKDVGMGADTETPYIMKMKNGEMSGRNSDIRYSLTGYLAKKGTNFETATSATGAITRTRFTYPIMRLADLYLMYAEALNESLDAPNDEVYQYVDIVRQRAGLKGVVESWAQYSNIPDRPLNKTGMREIIRHERLNELCFESQRFYDIRRWKIADKYFNVPERGWNASQNTMEEYYRVVIFDRLQFTTKMYLWPIRENELRININLVQNPYWN